MSDGLRALSRWSQRKLAARRGAPTPEPGEEATDAVRPGDEATASAQNPEQAATEAAGAEKAESAAAEQKVPALPPIEELNAQSDYSVFLAKGVPEELARAALRKLWTSDPVLANLDGLNNYDEDYNVIDTAITAAQTSYKPGIGYLEEIEEKLAQLDEAVGDDGHKPSEHARTGESDEQADSATRESGDGAGDQSTDAPQDEATVELDAVPGKPPEKAGA